MESTSDCLHLRMLLPAIMNLMSLASSMSLAKCEMPKEYLKDGLYCYYDNSLLPSHWK